MKTLLPEGRMNPERLFCKIFKLSDLRMFRFNIFHSMTAEGKKGFSKKVMFYFELKNIVSIFCVICTQGNKNNVKKVFWSLTFIKFIEVAKFPVPSSFFKGFQT